MNESQESELLARLDRIADALEKIASELNSTRYRLEDNDETMQGMRHDNLGLGPSDARSA